MSRWQSTLIALLCALIGFSVFIYKTAVLHFPVMPNAEGRLWTIQARVTFDTQDSSVRADLQLPDNPPGFTILEENFVSRGFGLTTETTKAGRVARWARRQVSGSQALYYRAVLVSDGSQPPNPLPPPFPEEPSLSEPYLSAMRSLVESTNVQSADVHTFTTHIIGLLNQENPGADVRLLLGEGSSLTRRAETAVVLLTGARVPVRLAYALDLTEPRRQARFIPWLEVHNGERWLYFDPTTGEQRLSEDILLWWRDPQDLIAVRGAQNPEVRISVQPSIEQQMMIAERRAELKGSRLVQFSVLGLPLQTQAVYNIILLIPIGALIMVLLRNLVGVKTFGIFTPVLVALAFRETRLFWGITLFLVVIALGLTLRAYLEHLRLLLVPRLAAVLTLVVLIMVGLSVVSHRLGLETGLSVALFPIVILTLAIERLSIVWEERGGWEATQEALGSLLVAVVSYLVMTMDFVEHLVLVFPETLLIVLALLLLLGRYRGFRLLELIRFKALAAEEP